MHVILAAGVAGGGMAMIGADQASAASLAPALASTDATAFVQKITHDPLARPGRYYSQPYAQNYSGYGYRQGYYRPAPSIGFGLSLPGFSVGVGTPSRYGYYGYGQPYYYGYGPYGNSVGYTGF
jgi:hypothetical protein